MPILWDGASIALSTQEATRLGEVVEADSVHFVAQSYTLNQPPPLGSIVRTSDGEITIYGVTSGARTGSIDPGRRPSARGSGEPTEEALFHNNPELADLLRTEFTALVVGYCSAAGICQHLPPRPPHVHGFVYLCSPDEVRSVTTRLDFIATLLTTGQRGSSDELVAACLREVACVHLDHRGYLLSAGKELATLLATDLSRLYAILRRIRP